MPNRNPTLRVKIFLTTFPSADVRQLLSMLYDAEVIEYDPAGLVFSIKTPKGIVDNRMWAERTVQFASSHGLAATIVRS